MNFTIIKAFYNIKGGAQKSTLTALAATAYHYRLPAAVKVAVIDADPQQTITRKRQRDLEDLEADPKKKEAYEALKEENYQKNNKKDIFPIFPISTRHTTEIKKKILELHKEGYNLILIDFPGSITDVGVEDILKVLNFVIVPLDWDDNSKDISYATLALLNKMKEEGKLRVKDISVVFTKYPVLNTIPKKKQREKFEEIRKELEEGGMYVWQNYFADSDHFKNADELLYSTLFPFPSLKKYENVNPTNLFKEIFMRMFTIAKQKNEQVGKEN